MTQIALITGAGSGIGRALAKVLAKEGYTVAGIDRRDDGLRTLAEEMPLTWAIADVTDPAALLQAVRDLEAKVGPTDLVVANAGIGAETSGLAYDIDAMNRVMNVNLLGVSNTIGAVLPGMLQRRRGHLVAISSVASYRGLPRMLAYCASKVGVNAIMDGLRVEVQPLGIDVTTICPGWVRTPLTAQIEGKLEHLTEVDDAAEEIAYAIRRKLPFYTFPRALRWKMGFLLWLPRSWQDWYIRRLMHSVRIKGWVS